MDRPVGFTVFGRLHGRVDMFRLKLSALTMAKLLPQEGGSTLPPELAQTRLENQELLALIYSFERRDGARIQPWQNGAPSPREHLERGGV